MLFEFGQYQIDVDVEKTKTFYTKANVVSDGCSCDGCRNYERAIGTLSHEIISFFDKLGVDMKKVCEVYVNCKNSDGTLLYGGFCHICGVLLLGENEWVSDSASASHWEDGKSFPITDSFHISFQKECSLLENEFPLPALQMEISANIPWVLPEDNRY